MRVTLLLALLGGAACGRVSDIDPMDMPDAPVPDAALPDSSAPPTCDDNAHNQTETDVDCGGPCAPCEPNKRCDGPADCATSSCVDGFCVLMTGPPSWVAGTALPNYNGSMGAGFADGTVWVVDGIRTAYWNGNGWTEIAAVDTRTIEVPTMTPSITGDGTNLWVAGGRDSDGERANRAWGLPPGAAAWTALAGITPARSSLALSMGPDGRLYALGGSIGVETSASAFNPAVEAYDPPPATSAVKSWDTTVPDLPFGVYRLAAATTGDWLYALGGTAFGGDIATTLRWKPGETMWATRAPMPAPLQGHGAAGGPDGRLYSVGGADTNGPTTAVNVYVPEIDHWFAIAPLATARSAHGVTIGPDGRIWAIGGLGPASLGSVEIYGPALGINPETGPAGTMIQIAGSNFAANATVTLRVGAPDSTPIGTVGTNGSGAMMNPHVYTVPVGTTPGTKITIHAVDEKSRYPVRRVFTVN